MKTWLPVLVGLAVIARESTVGFSSEHTGHILRPLWEFIFGKATDAAWDEIHFLIRKTGHFIGYGLLGLAWLRGWLLTWQEIYAPWAVRAWRLRCLAAAIACTAAVAACDELHQTTLPGRTGLASDVLLDTTGAAVMMLILALALRWWRESVPV